MIQPLEPQHFNDVIELGNLVHGNGYLDRASLQSIVDKGNNNGINSCFVAIESGRLLGFRLTYAADQWPIDPWCTPNRWGVNQTQVGYFKCNTVASDARGKGIGGLLLNAAIGALKQQGAIAGVSHLWQQSPHNSAVRYFTKAGGVLIKEHPDRWNNTLEHPDYNCVLCGPSCHCVACEMLLIF